MLAVQQGMQPVAYACAQPRPVEPLAQLVLATTCRPGRNVHPHQKIAAQQRGQCIAVDRIGLDLRFGDQSVLERMTDDSNSTHEITASKLAMQASLGRSAPPTFHL
jgi:hypothetical protein